MSTDYRALCAELLDWAERTSSHYYKQADVILRARAALAQPEPVAPSDEAIDEEAETVIPWLLEMAVQAANKDCPYAAGKLTLAAQLLGERRPANNTREEN